MTPKLTTMTSFVIVTVAIAIFLVSTSLSMVTAFSPSLSLKVQTTTTSFSKQLSQQVEYQKHSRQQQQQFQFQYQLHAKTEEDIEEEVARMVEEEKSKSKRMSNLRNERGVEYAPWMGISVEDEVRIKGIMRERAEARRKREKEQQNTKGSLLKDSTNQELSGTGLKSKLIDNTSVELEWVTGSEKNTAGFIVKRRTSKSGSDQFDTIASYETYGPLASKGINGGIYRYLDETIEPGNGYLYRITECDTNGDENDLSQCLVDVQTSEEQAGTKIALAGFALVAIAAIVSSLLLDPLQ
jgi:hypothetical protein